jgi:hypothetical protein
MGVQLRPEVQELLREELRAFADVLPGDYDALLAAVDAGELPDALLDPVGRLLEIGLQTGRIRKLHRAPGEQALLRLYGQTPAGKAQAQSVVEVNAALDQIAGQEIESVRVVARTPGTFLLQIGTDACEMTLKFSPDGAGVESVAVGI